MQQHPFLGQWDNRLAAPALAGASAALPVAGFMVCPAACLMVAGPAQAMMWQVYQIAYEQAQAVVRPSRLERLEKATLN